MASNYRQKSSSSGLRTNASAPRSSSRRAQAGNSSEFNNLNSIVSMQTRARKDTPYQAYNKPYRNTAAGVRNGIGAGTGAGAYRGNRMQTPRSSAQTSNRQASSQRMQSSNRQTSNQRIQSSNRQTSGQRMQASSMRAQRTRTQAVNDKTSRMRYSDTHPQITASVSGQTPRPYVQMPASTNAQSAQKFHPNKQTTARTRTQTTASANSRSQQSSRYVSRRLGDIQKQEHTTRSRNVRKGTKLRIAIIAIVLLLFVGGGIGLYLSPVFKIENINIEGAEHLTNEEMIALAAVPSDTTLLRVSTSQIQKNCERDAWIESVSVRKDFPNTLTLVVTEREIAAVVEVPSESSYSTRLWAISLDDMWLMPIPDKDSEAGQAISQQIYDDVENVMRIVDVPYSVVAEIGTYCTDSNINNAISIVSNMTTELKDEVTKVSATDSDSTTITLSNGVEVSFGTSDNLREKERIVLELLEEHEGSISYINVRSVNNPTWRSL